LEAVSTQVTFEIPNLLNQRENPQVEENLSEMLDSKLDVTGLPPVKVEELEERDVMEKPRTEDLPNVDSDSEDSLDEFKDFDEDTPIPEDWRQYTNSDGKNYFYNVKTRETIWIHPVLHLKKQGILLPSSHFVMAIPTPEKTVPKRAIAVPTKRPIWVDDKDVHFCESCRSKFGLTNRKHHCRSCGKIYCYKCCDVKRTLPKLGYKEAVLVCNHCLKLYDP